MGRKPKNQVIHLMCSPVVFSTMLSARTLGASAVENIELVTQVAASAVYIR